MAVAPQFIIIVIVPQVGIERTYDNTDISYQTLRPYISK